MSKVDALKNLAVAIGCAESTDKVKGTSVVEVLNFIAENYPKSAK